MMKLLISFCALLIGTSFASSLQLRDDLGFEPCNPDNWGEGNIDINPYPLPVVEGTQVDIKALFQLDKELDGDVDVKIKMVKTGIVNIPIPCLEIRPGVFLGSCHYNLEEIVQKYSDFLCPSFFPEGQECAFPLQPGEYGGEIAKITIPKVSDAVAGLARGTVKITLSVNRNEEEVFCINGNLELAK